MLKLQVTEKDLNMNLWAHINSEHWTRNWLVSPTFTASRGEKLLRLELSLLHWEISSAPWLGNISSDPFLHPLHLYVWKKRDNICCAAICIGLISTPILLSWHAPASPLFLPLPPSVHIYPNDYLNGCQKNTVTRLIWAVWECREEERGPTIFHTPFYRAGKWREGEREAVAMATCWQLLSLCLESAACSLSTQCLGGSGGWKEVRGRKEVMGKKSGWQWVGKEMRGKERWWDGE